MNNIDTLIAQLCPEGVEFRELGEVCLSISAGGDLPENYIKGQKFPTVELPYPIYSNGTENNALYGFTDSYRIGSEAVTISARGTIGYHTVRKSKFTPIVRLITLIPNKEIISTKFLNYVLDITPIGSSGGSIPQLTVPNVKKIQIPIPPFPIQQEIVTILDKFTQLQAELQTELQARRTQYEYYRNELLNFEGKEVEWKTLGEIGEFVRGNGLQKKDFTETGIGCIHYGQIYTYYGIFAHKTKTFISIEFAKKLRKAQKGDLVIATTSENVVDVCKTVAWLGDDEIAVSGDAYIYKHNQNPMYIAYNLQTPMFFDHKKKYMTGTKVIRVSGSDMAKFKIPIPPLAEQNRIVAILDKFDKLVNDISEGLPAEMQARRKQYEYYRGKLLEFKCLNR